MYEIEIRHNFETAHRLSHRKSPTKCRSIHGHSWWVTATLKAEELDEFGMVLEFGAFKRAWRQFLDEKIDHHLVLSEGDPFIAAIRDVEPESRILVLPADPTTEVLAKWVFDETELILHRLKPGVRLAKIHVQETAVNAASFNP